MPRESIRESSDVISERIADSILEIWIASSFNEKDNSMLAIYANNLMKALSTEIVAVNSTGSKVEVEMSGMLGLLVVRGLFALGSGCFEGR